MTIRPYTFKDFHSLREMLEKEEVGMDGAAFDRGETWVSENEGKIDGFFTITRNYGYPYLQHFCIERDVRNSKSNPMWRMGQKVKQVIGGRRFILLMPRGSERLIEVGSRYFKAKKFASLENVDYLITEIEYVQGPHNASPAPAFR